MGAVRHNSPRTVELLLSKGADLSPTNTRGENALDWAKQEKDAEVLKLIEEAMKKRG
jgi:ankyrin repeat protein